MIFDKLIEKIYRNSMFIRNDNASGIFYFSHEDFPGLQAHPYSFSATAGHNLKGYFYHYENPIPGRVIVFDHGMGNGHRAYMREIEQLAKAGFLVFSYDHTGCMESGGENTSGFAQSLNDLDACMTALEDEKALEGYTFSVMGHSWGGFSTMNICALHPKITHVVSMSGFVSVELILGQMISGIMKPYCKSLLALEHSSNPHYSHFHAVESLSNTTAQVLLIYSADDSIVSKQVHYDTLYKGLSDKENIHFLLVEGKDHNPNFTTDAVQYKNSFFKELTRREKKKLLDTPEKRQEFMASFDWYRMTAQDEKVWSAIIDHFKK